MKMRLEEANDVLNLCRQARQAPSSQLAGTLLRLTGPTMPPRLLKAANDAIFFCICGAEKEDAISLEQLPTLVGGEGELEFVEAQTA